MNNPSRARILVIDNDPQVGADLIEMLTPHDLSVEFLCTDSLEQQASLTDAVARCARRFRPHVAVVDVRLLDDYDPDARSVFAVLSHLESAQCILYSAHLDNKLTRQARQLHVIDWVSKASAPGDLVQAVIDAARRQSPRVSAMTIRWPDGWDGHRLLKNLLEDEAGDAPETLFDDVVAQLALDRSSVEMHMMGVHDDAPPAASRGRSAVVQLKADNLTPSVLKLAKAARARRESHNYEAHIRNQLPGSFHTQLLASAVFWDVGGSLYSFMGTTRIALPTFSKFYRDTADPQDILKPLGHFFTEVWAQHYTDNQTLPPLPPLPLADLYENTFGIESRVTNQELSQLSAWLSAAKTQYKEVVGRQAITHGDFHGDNLFTDGAHLWVIDFERTGPHHALLDFVEMEVDILTRLMGVDDSGKYSSGKYNDDGFFDLYLCDDKARFQAELDGVSPAGQKTLRVVEGIRQMARRVCNFSIEEYRLGLLYEAIYVATIGSIPQQQRQRALRLCRALAQALKLE